LAARQAVAENAHVINKNISYKTIIRMRKMEVFRILCYHVKKTQGKMKCTNVRTALQK